MARKLRHQWARPLFVIPRAEDENADGLVLFDHRQDFGHGFAFADDQFGIDALFVAHPFRKDLKMGDNPFARFFAHDLAHTDPVIEFFGCDDRQDRNPCACMRGTHRGKAHRVQAFTAIVQNHKKLTHRVPLWRDIDAMAGARQRLSLIQRRGASSWGEPDARNFTDWDVSVDTMRPGQMTHG